MTTVSTVKAVKKEKKPGYEIKFMPNTKGERGWTKGSNPDSKEVETATFIGANEDIILSQVIKMRVYRWFLIVNTNVIEI